MNIFEPIRNYEEYYSINRSGEIMSNKTKRILKPRLNKYGYLRVNLYKKTIVKTFYIYRLLALQFLPNPYNYPLIDHIDQNKNNNSLDNLRWTTISVNNRNCNKQNKSGFPNIMINQWGSFRVMLYLNNKRVFDKSFKTLDEALSERDWAFDMLGIENNCYK
jgi:hypothetical protein